ncbi:unnamed protein product, partial [Iphiclides podalirius]
MRQRARGGRGARSRRPAKRRAERGGGRPPPPRCGRCSATHSPRSPTSCCWPSPPEPATQPQGVLQRLVRRLTRVWVRCDEAQALAKLTEELSRRHYRWRYLHPRMLAVECGGEERMRVWAVRAAVAGGAGGAGGGEARVVLEFRRSRGCGLQFKRRFVELRAALQPLAAPPPPCAHSAELDVPLDAPLDTPLDTPLDAHLEPMDQT